MSAGHPSDRPPDHPSDRPIPLTEIAALVTPAGFARIGCAAVDDAPPGERELREWLRRGYHGEMAYLARNVDRRVDPRRVLDGARSVVALAVEYGWPGSGADDAPEAAEGADRATIASYARGDDYHRIIERRLRLACHRLAEAFPHHRFRYYVDTGPVLEKAWAARAGLGWIGKNTCLIDPGTGSYFFVAVILSDLAIEPSDAIDDHCGRCQLCVDACPTGALDEPYVLDARRCISYLTIEHRGAIDPSLEPGVGNLVFGCDICQDVCPWNESVIAPDAELASRAENVSPRLADLAELDEEGFRERFRRSPVRRAKHRGLLRNVAVAIGNSGDERLGPLLDALEARAPGDAMIAETAARARRRLTGGDAAASRP